MPTNYRVEVTDLAGVTIEEIPAKNLEYSYVLNDVGGCSFTLPKYHSKCTKSLMDPGRRQILVYKDQTKVWGGYLWLASASGDQDEVRFGCDGWFSRLDRRYVRQQLTFTSTDQFNIAWGLINYTQTLQNGDLGIVRNPTEILSGIMRDVTYFDYDRPLIGDAIRTMASSDNGFDFEITPDKQWNAYYPQKGRNTNFVFELNANMHGYSYDLDASNTMTEYTAIGFGDGKNTLLSVVANTAAQESLGLLQIDESFKDVKDTKLLQGIANSNLTLRKDHAEQPQISLRPQGDIQVGSFATGDIVKLIIDDGFAQTNDYFRIGTITVQIDNNGRESISVFLDSKVVA